MFALLAVFVTLAATTISAQGHGCALTNPLLSSCDASAPVSCSRDSSSSDDCCYESPRGLILQTQFWETRPATGPSDSWTIHGLWNDNCDGTFPPRGCDPSRAYTDIGGLLASQGAGDTLSYMKKYWVDYHGQDEHFWEHEWNNHGTCYTTLRPSCLPPDSPEGADAVAYFRQVVGLFQTLPTYDWLAAQGITPTFDETYSLSDMTNAIKAAHGYTPEFECSGSLISQINFYFYVKGSVLDGEWVPIDTPKHSRCPSQIRYPPKSRHGGHGFSDSIAQIPLN